MFIIFRFCHVVAFCTFFIIFTFQVLWASSHNMSQTKGDSQPLSGNATGKNKDHRQTDKKMPVYRPPLRGAPMGRVAGGTRGAGDKIPYICALVPEHVGLTTMSQPTLYWYISEPSPHEVVFTINSNNSTLPLLETSLPKPEEAGIRAVDLSHFNITLETGQTYIWFVALVPDDQNRSKDIITRGGIRKINLASELKRNIKKQSTTEKIFVYANNGLWYDALHSLMKKLLDNTKKTSEIHQLKFLFDQAHLPDIVILK